MNKKINRNFLVKRDFFDNLSDFLNLSQNNAFISSKTDFNFFKFQDFVDNFFFSCYKPFFDNFYFSNNENFVFDFYERSDKFLKNFKKRLPYTKFGLFQRLHNTYNFFKIILKELNELNFLLNSLKKTYKNLDDSSSLIFTKIDSQLSQISQMKIIVSKLMKDWLLLFTEFIRNKYKGFHLQRISNDFHVFLKPFHHFFSQLHTLNYENLNLQKFFKQLPFEELEEPYSISNMRQYIDVIIKNDLLRLYNLGLDDLGYALEVFFDDFPAIVYRYDDTYYSNFFDTFKKAKQSLHSNFSHKNIFAQKAFFYLKNPFFNYGTKVVTDDVLGRN